MHQKKQWIAVAISLALSQAAWAQDGGDDRFKLSGFGTVGLTHSSEGLADVTPDFQTSRGVGASSSTSAKLDSRLGVQFSAQFTDNFSGVVQAVSEYAVTESYKPELTLAHVKYRFSSAFTARLGRITAPLYMLSEYQRVNYAVPWARPPYEVYNYLVPLDGIDATYKINAGDSVVGFQGFYGQIDSRYAGVDALRGLAVTVEHGDSSFRLARIIGRAHYRTPNIDALFNFYRGLPVPPFGALVDAATKLDPRSMNGSFSSIGYSYDPGNLFLRAEAIRANYSPAISGRTVAGYASAGVRIGRLTPAFTFGYVDSGGRNPPGALDVIPGSPLNNAVLAADSSRHSFAASLRWDVYRNIAVKLQASHIKNHAGSFGSLGNQQPGFQPGRSYNLLSANVDFVF